MCGGSLSLPNMLSLLLTANTVPQTVLLSPLEMLLLWLLNQLNKSAELFVKSLTKITAQATKNTTSC